jgi:hypothetical protein
MPEIRVLPAALRDAASKHRQAGDHVRELANASHLILGAGGVAPSATTASLHGFHASWSAGVADVGQSLKGLAITTDVAAGLYEQTDAGVVPEP